MDAEYTVELVNFKIDQLSIKTDLKENAQLDLAANYSVKMAEPQSSDVQMAMLEIEADINDENEQLQATCRAFFVFKIDPIPEDWQKVINKKCPDTVHNLIMDRLYQILVSMGLLRDPE